MANLKGDSVDNICCIKYASTSIKCCSLGSNIEGGYLIYKAGGRAIIAAPNSAIVIRTWGGRGDAVTTAQNTSPFCQDWYIPHVAELNNYTDFTMASYYDTYYCCLWSDTERSATTAAYANPFTSACYTNLTKTSGCRVRAFRDVFY